MESRSPVLELTEGFKRREQGGVAFELAIPDLRLYAGQFVAIVGDSGCGKSTLLDILALVSKPSRCATFVYSESDGGERGDGLGIDPKLNLKLDLKRLWERADEGQLAALRRSRLGYVLQTGGLLPFLTAFQNVQLPSLLNGRRHDDAIRALARRLGVDGVLEKKPQYLSGGQRQRVAILRAVQHHPRIILADEPTAAVDKTRARSIVQDFDALARDTGATIVMVTHDHDLVAPLADVTYSFEVEELSDSLTRSTCRRR